MGVQHKYYTKYDSKIDYRFVVYTEWDDVAPEGYERITLREAEIYCTGERQRRKLARCAGISAPIECDTYIWPYPIPDYCKLVPKGYKQIKVPYSDEDYS